MTLNYYNKPNTISSVDTQLPEKLGYVSYVPKSRQYGQKSTINFLITLANEWAKLHPQGPRIQIGDISKKYGGQMYPHSSHKKGLDVDIRPVKSDNSEGPTNIKSRDYSQKLTKEIILLVHKISPKPLILFNDKTLIDEGLVKFAPGHHNHLHIRFPSEGKFAYFTSNYSFSFLGSNFKDPMELPEGKKVDFAPEPSGEVYWPIITSLKDWNVVTYRYGPKKNEVEGGPTKREFFATRGSNRYHGAVDLYADYDDRVIACEEGFFIDFIDNFLRTDPKKYPPEKYPQKHKSYTSAIFIKHPKVIVLYGEIKPKSWEKYIGKKGEKVKAGQIIAEIGRNPNGSKMLHFETWNLELETVRNRLSGSFRAWSKPEKPPPHLLNPTKYLLYLKEKGLRKTSDNISIPKPTSDKSILSKFKDYVIAGKIYAAVGLALLTGINNENDITDLIFYARHRNLDPKVPLKPNQTELIKEWRDIKNHVKDSLAKLKMEKSSTSISNKNLNGTSKPSSILTAPSTVSMGEKTGISPDIKIVRAQYKHKEGNKTILWKGVNVRGDQEFQAFYKDELDMILGTVVDVEGKYDTVNMYDKGILSWGISQWTLHAGSLQNALYRIKQRLVEKGKNELWLSLFPDVDVQFESGKYVIFYKGKMQNTNDELMITFRGKISPDEYNEETINYWAKIFANAGKNQTIIQLQNELGRNQIKALFDKNLSKLPYYELVAGKWRSRQMGSKYDKRVIDYLGDSSKAKTLFYGMWVNNPTWAYTKFKDAIDKIAIAFNTYKIAEWPQGWSNKFEKIFENVLLTSGVGYWGRANAAKANRTSRTDKLLHGYEKYKKLFSL